MQSQNFTCAFTVEQSPVSVFDAINNVRGWWTGEVAGNTAEVGEEFSYSYPGFHYSKQKIVELIPGEKVAWHVVDAQLDGFEDPTEWIGTDITFDIATNADDTEVRFSHVGLAADFECFESCSSAWVFFVYSSLKRLIMTGEGPATPPWE